MVKLPTRFLTQETLHKLLDPGRVFYRVAVDDVLERGEHAEILAMLQGAKAVKEHYGDLDKLIGKLESAAKKAQQ